MRRPSTVWPPSRNGCPTCPGCGGPVTRDPGTNGIMPDPDQGWKVGRYAHAACAAAVPAADTATENTT